MPAYSVWESRLYPRKRKRVARSPDAIRRDRTQFDGCLTHELIGDVDDPGHLLVVSQWTTGHRVDEVLREYPTIPTHNTQMCSSRHRGRGSPATRCPVRNDPGSAAGCRRPDFPRQPDRGPTIHPDPLASPATAALALGLQRLDASQHRRNPRHCDHRARAQHHHHPRLSQDLQPQLRRLDSPATAAAPNADASSAAR
jgi:hypothetical protein